MASRVLSKEPLSVPGDAPEVAAVGTDLSSEPRRRWPRESRRREGLSREETQRSPEPAGAVHLNREIVPVGLPIPREEFVLTKRKSREERGGGGGGAGGDIALPKRPTSGKASKEGEVYRNPRTGPRSSIVNSTCRRSWRLGGARS